MDSNERNLFSQFERQPYVDLTEWRTKLITYTESHLTATEEELRKYIGTSVTPATHESLMNSVMSQFLQEYMEQIEPVVQPGDRIRAAGGIIYDIYTQSGHDFESEWLREGSELWGRFETIAVRDYLDESILDADLSQLTEEYVGAHIRRYGTHLVLADPVEIKPDGSEHSIPDCESVFIPLMYRRLNLAGYLAWNV
jgi:hypothetical protein